MRPTRRPARVAPAAIPALLLAVPYTAVAQRADTTLAGDQAAAFVGASVAWERGEYPIALRALSRLLDGSGGERAKRSVALLTGELYRTDSLAADGRALRVSADGRHVAWETGTGSATSTTVARVEGRTVRPVATVAGGGLALAPSGARVAYLKVPDSEAVRAARAEVARLTAPGAERNAALQQLAATEGRLARVVVRELDSGAETEAVDDDLVKRSAAFASDGATVYFVGWPAAGGDTAVYAVALGGGAPRRLTRVAGADVTSVPGGRHLLVTPAAGPGFGAAAQRARSFSLVDLATGEVRTIAGLQPSVAANGSAVAWLIRERGESVIQVMGLDTAARQPAPNVRVEHAPITVTRTADTVETPVLSPDGRRVAYASMPSYDWELFVVPVEGPAVVSHPEGRVPSRETRLTREIQHDRVPRWVDATTLLAAKGEPRHRRSYLYDVTTGRATRLFHNNTVRTIAPEYEWVVTPDGGRVFVVAERDGDTVSPERGVYAVDLTRELTVAELRQRLQGMLAAEDALRARARALFAPVREVAKRAADSVSVERLYGYQKALFDFGSKHITRPGNAPARQYLFDTYRSFGYEPAFMPFEPRVAGPSVPSGQATATVQTANVLATLRGTENPELVYVVGSHFDSRAEGPGADDNTSGTAMLLETARVLAKAPLPATVVFVSFTGEESGLLGSREFARRAAAEGWKVVGAMNNDMMGWSNDQRLDNTIRYSNPGIRDAQHAAALGFSRLVTYDAVYYKSTDAHALYDAFGDVVGGFGSYPVLGNPHYHQPHDVLETVNQELVAETTRANVATVVLLASSPSRVTGLAVTREGGGVALRWNASPERGVGAYRVAYGPADDPLRTVVTVRGPSAQLPNVPAGAVVSVKAVNGRGVEGWDWARAVVR